MRDDEGLDLDGGVPSVLLCVPGGGRLSFAATLAWTATIGAIMHTASVPLGRSHCSIHGFPSLRNKVIA